MAGAGGATLSERLVACKLEIERLKAAIAAQKLSLQNGGLRDVPGTHKPLGPPLKRARQLIGHFGKVYAADWSLSGEELVSTGQDSKIMHWDALGNHKLASVPLKVIWAMTVAFDPLAQHMVACGGLDNACSLYSLRSGERIVEMEGHEGYVSSVRFPTAGGTPSGHILTASGDSTIIVWDARTSRRLHVYLDHGSDVLALSCSPADSNIFVSGSVDSSARVWDIRAPRAVQVFLGHEGDVNAVSMMPSGLSFATGGDDASVKVFDMRAYAKVNEFASEAVVTPATSVDFSASGRLLFAGHDDSNVYAWDALADSMRAPAYTLAGHANHVSAVRVNPQGQALFSASWDHEISIWA